MSSEERIRFNAPFIAGDELSYIHEAVAEGRLSGDGPFTRRCHEWLEQQLGCSKALLTHSGTSALEMAAILLDVAPGDEVIMPSFTFVTTATAFVLRGATPVFVDVRPEDHNICPEAVRNAITPKTRAIVPVHYGGVSCDMVALSEIAEQHDLFIVEDAAHAILASSDDRALGTIGDLGCLSFHETKNIISGEGGALLINDESLVERAMVVWEKGTNRHNFNLGKVNRYSWQDLGSSFPPSELTAAFLLAQLEQAEKITQKRREVFLRYREAFTALATAGLARLPAQTGNQQMNAHMFYLLVDSRSVRDALIEHLDAAGIMATFHYVPLHSSPGGMKFGRAVGDMTNTQSASEGIVRLPLHYRLESHDVDRVIDEVLGFFGERSALS